MGVIVKGYWTCEVCGTKDIDGLVDVCPNCGKQKSKTVKYYLREVEEVVTDEELKKAGISKEECDGNHKDWVCNYCDQLNNWSDDFCSACGAPKDEATHEYGMKSLRPEPQPSSSVKKAAITQFPEPASQQNNIEKKENAKKCEKKCEKNAQF